MNKEELLKKFEENVQYLKRNVPPDDIYLFAEQTFMAALFFLHKWSDWTDMNQEMKDDPIVKKWVTNILAFHDLKDKGIDVEIDLDMKSIEGE